MRGCLLLVLAVWGCGVGFIPSVVASGTFVRVTEHEAPGHPHCQTSRWNWRVRLPRGPLVYNERDEMTDQRGAPAGAGRWNARGTLVDSDLGHDLGDRTVLAVGHPEGLELSPYVLDGIPRELQDYAKRALMRMGDALNCTLGKCLMSQLYDEIWEHVGDPMCQDASVVTAAARDAYHYVCKMFGPSPFAPMCDFLVVQRTQAVLTSLSKREDIEDFLNNMGVCVPRREWQSDLKAEPSVEKELEEDDRLRVALHDQGLGNVQTWEGIVVRLFDDEGGTLFDDDELSRLSEEAKERLHAFKDALGAFPGRTIHITAHSNTQQNAMAAKDTTERRARLILNYLKDELGMPNEMKAIGVGDAEPIAEDDTLDGQFVNRCVELTVLDSKHLQADHTQPASLGTLYCDEDVPKPPWSNDRTQEELNEANWNITCLLLQLEDYLEDIFHPMKCSACRCIMGFMYDELEVPLARADLRNPDNDPRTRNPKVAEQIMNDESKTDRQIPSCCTCCRPQDRTDYRYVKECTGNWTSLIMRETGPRGIFQKMRRSWPLHVDVLGEVLDKICAEMSVPPFDIMCKTMKANIQDITKLVVMQRSVKYICSWIGMCRVDGVSPGRTGTSFDELWKTKYIGQSLQPSIEWKRQQMHDMVQANPNACCQGGSDVCDVVSRRGPIKYFLPRNLNPAGAPNWFYNPIEGHSGTPAAEPPGANRHGFPVEPEGLQGPDNSPATVATRNRHVEDTKRPAQQSSEQAEQTTEHMEQETKKGLPTLEEAKVLDGVNDVLSPIERRSLRVTKRKIQHGARNVTLQGTYDHLVATYTDGGGAHRDAQALFDAMNVWNIDVARIYRILEGKSRQQIDALKRAFDTVLLGEGEATDCPAQFDSCLKYWIVKSFSASAGDLEEARALAAYSVRPWTGQRRRDHAEGMVEE